MLDDERILWCCVTPETSEEEVFDGTLAILVRAVLRHPLRRRPAWQ
jgi:hypothetical protein